jgi:hypothetical protein
MELSKQVCTLEQAKRLKELGVDQKGYFMWQETCDVDEYMPQETVARFDEEAFQNIGIAAAFTVAELGEMIPDSLLIDGYYRCHFHEYKQGRNKQPAIYTCTFGKSEDKEVPDFDSTNEAESRAALLIYLLENKLATPHNIESIEPK